MRATMIVALLLSIICVNSVIGAPDKHAMKNECKYNNLDSGTYRCILSDDEKSFFVDCMTDGTMYINPSQQSLYHYYKQAGLEMRFKLILSAQYGTIEDVDDDQIESLSLKEGETSDISDEDEIYDWNNPLLGGGKKSGSSQSEGIDDSTLDDDSLEQEELTKAEKSSVNKTAQYIVYGVIIVMALIFSIGICLLIYWWCCHQKILNKHRMNENIITNNDDDRSGRLLIDDQDNDNDNDDETQPFIDIRGSKTIHRQYLKSQGRTIYFGIGVDRNNHQNILESSMNNDDDIDIIQRERHNIYDDINGADDDEDGDDLIAHYGSTSNNGGYVIAKFPNNE